MKFNKHKTFILTCIFVHNFLCTSIACSSVSQEPTPYEIIATLHDKYYVMLFDVLAENDFKNMLINLDRIKLIINFIMDLQYSKYYQMKNYNVDQETDAKLHRTLYQCLKILADSEVVKGKLEVDSLEFILEQIIIIVSAQMPKYIDTIKSEKIKRKTNKLLDKLWKKGFVHICQILNPYMQQDFSTSPIFPVFDVGLTPVSNALKQSNLYSSFSVSKRMLLYMYIGLDRITLISL